MRISPATRAFAKMRLLLQGASGSGKSLSSLLIAHGLSAGDLTKVVVVDSERQSADLYADIGPYNVLPLVPPYTPEQYCEAIATCERAGMEVIILDGISSEWNALLDYHDQLPGGNFSNWAKVTPRHNKFIDAILSSSCHIIATVRAKSDYIMVEKNGKQVPEKVGLKAIQREGIEYEFAVVFELGQQHFATATKDRTRLFADKPPFIPNVETGKQLLQWCQTGVEVREVDMVKKMIFECKNMNDLMALYYQYPQHNDFLKQEFSNRKALIQSQSNRQLQPH